MGCTGSSSTTTTAGPRIPPVSKSPPKEPTYPEAVKCENPPNGFNSKGIDEVLNADGSLTFRTVPGFPWKHSVSGTYNPNAHYPCVFPTLNGNVKSVFIKFNFTGEWKEKTAIGIELISKTGSIAKSTVLLPSQAADVITSHYYLFDVENPVIRDASAGDTLRVIFIKPEAAKPRSMTITKLTAFLVPEMEFQPIVTPNTSDTPGFNPLIEEILHPDGSYTMTYADSMAWNPFPPMIKENPINFPYTFPMLNYTLSSCYLEFDYLCYGMDEKKPIELFLELLPFNGKPISFKVPVEPGLTLKRFQVLFDEKNHVIQRAGPCDVLRLKVNVPIGTVILSDIFGVLQPKEANKPVVRLSFEEFVDTYQDGSYIQFYELSSYRTWIVPRVHGKAMGFTRTAPILLPPTSIDIWFCLEIIPPKECTLWTEFVTLMKGTGSTIDWSLQLIRNSTKLIVHSPLVQWINLGEGLNMIQFTIPQEHELITKFRPGDCYQLTRSLSGAGTKEIGMKLSQFQLRVNSKMTTYGKVERFPVISKELSHQSILVELSNNIPRKKKKGNTKLLMASSSAPGVATKAVPVSRVNFFQVRRQQQGNPSRPRNYVGNNNTQQRRHPQDRRRRRRDPYDRDNTDSDGLSDHDFDSPETEYQREERERREREREEREREEREKDREDREDRDKDDDHDGKNDNDENNNDKDNDKDEDNNNNNNDYDPNQDNLQDIEDHDFNQGDGVDGGNDDQNDNNNEDNADNADNDGGYYDGGDEGGGYDGGDDYGDNYDPFNAGAFGGDDDDGMGGAGDGIDYGGGDGGGFGDGGFGGGDGGFGGGDGGFGGGDGGAWGGDGGGGDGGGWGGDGGGGDGGGGGGGDGGWGGDGGGGDGGGGDGGGGDGGGGDGGGGDGGGGDGGGGDGGGGDGGGGDGGGGGD